MQPKTQQTVITTTLVKDIINTDCYKKESPQHNCIRGYRSYKEPCGYHVPSMRYMEKSDKNN